MRHPIWIATSAAVLAAIVWTFFSFSKYASRGGTSAPLYSAQRHDPYGTAALRALLTARKTKVRLARRAILKPATHAILIEIFPSRKKDLTGRRPPTIPVRQLLRFLRSGDTILQFTQQATPLTRRLHLSIRHAWGSDPNNMFSRQEKGGPPERFLSRQTPCAWRLPAGISVAGPGDHHFQPLTLWSPATIDLSGGHGWQKVAWRGRHVHAAWRKVGNGKLIVVGSTAPPLNIALGRGGNLPFILSIIGHKRVYLDEFTVGEIKPYTIIALLARVGLVPLLFQMALLLFIYGLSTRQSVRPAPARRRPARQGIEQMLMLARLYGQTLPEATVAKRVGREVTVRMTDALACGAEQLPNRLRALPRNLQETAQRLLRDADALALAAEPSRRCPQCGAAMDHTRVACASCGHAPPPPAAIPATSAAPATPVTAPAARQPISFETIKRLLADSAAWTKEVHHARTR